MSIVSKTVQRYEKNLKLPNNLTHFNNFLYLIFDISHHICHVCHNGSIENWMAHLNLVKTIAKGVSFFISKPNVHLEQAIHTDAEKVSVTATRTLKIQVVTERFWEGGEILKLNSIELSQSHDCHCNQQLKAIYLNSHSFLFFLFNNAKVRKKVEIAK